MTVIWEIGGLAKNKTKCKNSFFYPKDIPNT